MQALILRDPFDDPSIVRDLYEHLQGFKIVEIKSIKDLTTAKSLLDQNEPCLYYHNVFIRLENPKEIWEYHKSVGKISILKIGGEIISIIPSLINSLGFGINTLTYSSEIEIANRRMTVTSTKERPMCFLYTQSRDVYLRLTLNSLLFATKDIDLKIVMNDPTHQVEVVCLEFAAKYKNIEVFKTGNSFISAVNLMIQWFNPERFIIMEDDMIYPPSTKDLFPNFCHQFISRLDYFDLCAWSVGIDNGNSYMAHSRSVDHLAPEWEIMDKNSKNILLAQCVACKTSYYKDVMRSYIGKDSKVRKYYANYDSHIIASANRGICYPSLRGYHIGWNQEMDGFVRLQEGSRHPDFKSHIFRVESLNTGEVRNIDLRELI